MKKVVFLLLLIGGAYASYRMRGVHWMIAFIGLCLAFGFLFKKLPTGSASRLVGFVILFVVVMLGGGVILARQWGGSSRRSVDFHMSGFSNGLPKQDQTEHKDLPHGRRI
jgi:hypothetical protein